MYIFQTKSSQTPLRSCVKISALLALSIGAAGASGYKIPEQSLSALALSAANVAAVDGADASYYNPANMVFLSNPKSELELILTYVNLPYMTYKDNLGRGDVSSETERFAAPLGHFVIPEHYKDWRLGFSVVVPGGLSKRWYGSYASAAAEIFSMKIIEANPTAAYKINDWVSLGFGLRAIYSTGKVKTSILGLPSPYGGHMKLEGDSYDFGYNLALSVRPIDSLKLAATYRSKVDLTITGDADLSFNVPSVASLPDYKGGASVKIPLPATFDIAAAYTFNKKTTVEVVYERVFWSAYKDLHFKFTSGGMDASMIYGGAKPKDWKDSNTYRLGLSHWVNDDLKLMVGFTYDETPTPDKSFGFELPDSNSKNYSFGFEYKINEDMSIGAAYLYSDKEKRTAKNSANPLVPLDGEFGHGGAHLVNMAFKYRF